MGESPEAKKLREAIEEQGRIDQARIDQAKTDARDALDRRQNERDRQAEAQRLREAAGEA
jgi:hypothetical protein